MFARCDLKNLRAIVTGASSGIGWALAHQLADQGMRLTVASRNESNLHALVDSIKKRGGQALAIATDVTDPAGRAHLIDASIGTHGGLDVLMNNAGVGAMTYFSNDNEQLLRQIFEVNFFGCTELTRLALPHLMRSSSAMLVNVSSVLGRRAIPGCSEYCASKFALAGWSESIRAEFAGHNIHVLLVCPGVIQTKFKQNLLADRLRFRWQNHRAMTADRCARLIVRAMWRKQNELVTTTEGNALVWANRFFPRLLDYLMARFAKPMKEQDPVVR